MINWETLKTLITVIFERVFVIFLSFCSNIILVRALKIDEFGQFQHFLSLVYIVGTLLLFASAQSIQALYTSSTVDELDITAVAFLIRLFSAVFGFASLVFYICVYENSNISSIALAGVLFLEPVSIFSLYLYQKGDSYINASARISGTVGKFLFILIGYKLECGIEFMALGWVLDIVIQFFILFDSNVVNRALNLLLKSRHRFFECCSKIIGSSVGYIPYIFSQAFIVRADRLLMPTFVGAIEFAQLALAMSIIDQASAGMTLFLNAVVKKFNKNHPLGEIHSVFGFSLALAILYFISVFLFSEYLANILHSVYGDKFLSAKDITITVMYLFAFQIFDSVLVFYFVVNRIFFWLNARSVFLIVMQIGFLYFGYSYFNIYSIQFGLAAGISIYWIFVFLFKMTRSGNA